MPEYTRFVAAHLDGVLRLCTNGGWPSFPADPARAMRVLTAPGATTVVAYLANMVVDETRRSQGIGRAMVNEALRLAGGERIDLLSQDDATEFYRTFPDFEKPGFRLYPFYQDSTEAS